jgi:hypothetical protein
MSSTITAGDQRRPLTHAGRTSSRPDTDTLARARADVLAAVAEAQAADTAGATNAALGALTPDLALDARTAAVISLIADGLLTRRGLHLRFAAAGRVRCRNEWTDETTTTATTTGLQAATPSRAHRRLTCRDAQAIVEQFAALAERCPELAAEVGGGFAGPWRTLERAVAEGNIKLGARMAAQVQCLTAEIRDRLAEVTAA